MPMEPIPGPGLEPQPPFFFSDHHTTDADKDVERPDGQPISGFYEPGIPTGDDPHAMHRFRDEHDLECSVFTASRSHSSSSSTGVLFPLLILGVAIWFALSSQSIRIPFFQSVQQEQQTQ